MKPLKELQLLAAKKLPEKIYHDELCGFFWSPEKGKGSVEECFLDGILIPVLETEWLYICIELLEPMMTDEEYKPYKHILTNPYILHKEECNDGDITMWSEINWRHIISTTAHQRLQAMNEIGFI